MCPLPSQPGVGHCSVSWELLGNNLLGREGEQGPGDSVAARGLRGGLDMLNQMKQKAILNRILDMLQTFKWMSINSIHQMHENSILYINPFMSSGLFYHNSLNQSISSNRMPR